MVCETFDILASVLRKYSRRIPQRCHILLEGNDHFQFDKRRFFFFFVFFFGSLPAHTTYRSTIFAWWQRTEDGAVGILWLAKYSVIKVPPQYYIYIYVVNVFVAVLVCVIHFILSLENAPSICTKMRNRLAKDIVDPCAPWPAHPSTTPQKLFSRSTLD